MTSRPASSRAPRSPVCSQPSAPSVAAATVRPRTRTSPSCGDAKLGAEQRDPVGGDLRARLGHAVGRRHGDSCGACAGEQRRRDRPAAEQHPAQRRRRPQARVEQAREHRRHQRDERHPLRRVHERRERALGIEALVQKDRGAVDGRADLDGEPADVGQRHRAQPCLVGVQAQRQRRAQRVPQPVVVAERHRLGARCGPRGEHERGRRVRVHRAWPARRRHRRRGRSGRASRISDACAVRSACSASVSRRSIGNRHDPEEQAGVQSDHQLGAGQDQGHMVARRHAPGLERGGDGAGPVVELGVGGLDAVRGPQCDTVAVDPRRAGEPGFHGAVRLSPALGRGPRTK